MDKYDKPMVFMITGASRGIGLETALALVKNGPGRVVCLSRNKSGLEKLLETATNQKLPGEIILMNADLVTLSKESLLEFLDKNNISQVDGLVNNAGLLINKPFEQLTSDDFRKIYETNVFAPARLVQYLIPYFKKSKHPHIVNISSLGGFQGTSKFRGLSAYSSSKAALACLSECLAIELSEDKISVNALALGSVDTEMLQLAFPGFQAPVSAAGMGEHVADFTINGHRFYNGKVLPVSLAAQ